MRTDDINAAFTTGVELKHSLLVVLRSVQLASNGKNRGCLSCSGWPIEEQVGKLPHSTRKISKSMLVWPANGERKSNSEFQCTRTKLQSTYIARPKCRVKRSNNLILMRYVLQF